MKGFGAGFVIPGAAAALSGALVADAVTRQVTGSNGFLLDAYDSFTGAGDAVAALTVAVLAGAATAVGIVVLMVFFALFDRGMIAQIRLSTMEEMRKLGVDTGAVMQRLAGASPTCDKDDPPDTARMITALGLTVAADPVAREIEYRRQLRQVASGLIPTVVLLVAWAVVAADGTWGGRMLVVVALAGGYGAIRMLRVAAKYQESERAFQAFVSAARAAAGVRPAENGTNVLAKRDRVPSAATPR